MNASSTSCMGVLRDNSQLSTCKLPLLWKMVRCGLKPKAKLSRRGQVARARSDAALASQRLLPEAVSDNDQDALAASSGASPRIRTPLGQGRGDDEF